MKKVILLAVIFFTAATQTGYGQYFRNHGREDRQKRKEKKLQKEAEHKIIVAPTPPPHPELRFGIEGLGTIGYRYDKASDGGEMLRTGSGQVAGTFNFLLKHASMTIGAAGIMTAEESFKPCVFTRIKLNMMFFQLSEAYRDPHVTFTVGLMPELTKERAEDAPRKFRVFGIMYLGHSGQEKTVDEPSVGVGVLLKY